MKQTAVSLLVHLHENPWTFAAFTSLALGGWFYLLAKEKKALLSPSWWRHRSHVDCSYRKKDHRTHAELAGQS